MEDIHVASRHMNRCSTSLHQGNANQNHLTPVRMAVIKKTTIKNHCYFKLKKNKTI